MFSIVITIIFPFPEILPLVKPDIQACYITTSDHRFSASIKTLIENKHVTHWPSTTVVVTVVYSDCLVFFYITFSLFKMYLILILKHPWSFILFTNSSYSFIPPGFLELTGAGALIVGVARIMIAKFEPLN